ncbi:MAG TPA: hypothetical protein VFY28_02330 [Candidatus Paceibacterota bacterium]|nr:hypothetical protein [Candidatus Paceibacterota bacterium]
MSRESMLILSGVLVMLSPFSGFPLSLLTWFYLFVGLVVTLIGVSFRLLRRRRSRKHAHEASAPVLS